MQPIHSTPITSCWDQQFIRLLVCDSETALIDVVRKLRQLKRLHAKWNRKLSCDFPHITAEDDATPRDEGTKAG